MSEDGPPPLPPGAEPLPGYRVLGHIGRGRTLDVHDAWSDERATRCILKLLRPDRAGDRTAARRLVAEGRLLLRLSHPHIVRGYAVAAEPRPAVVMETLSGRTLAHLIDESPRRLARGEVVHLGLHLASALRYLHGRGWLHLDLKPTNVVAEAGRAKLIDMSIARRPGRGRPGVGTRCYMAPEQALGGDLGPAADVWGLGAVLFEAAAGEPAFDSDLGTRAPSDLDTEERHPQLAGPARPVRRLRRGLPGPLAEIIDASLRQDPARRPATDEVIAALAGLVPGYPSST
ncbi:MAG: serine/threonine-protein kinase [Thermoleophilia bacterium]